MGSAIFIPITKSPEVIPAHPWLLLIPFYIFMATCALSSSYLKYPLIFNPCTKLAPSKRAIFAQNGRVAPYSFWYEMVRRWPPLGSEGGGLLVRSPWHGSQEQGRSEQDCKVDGRVFGGRGVPGRSREETDKPLSVATLAQLFKKVKL